METQMGFTKDQWIIIRLLYIMLAIDPTLVRAKDVELTIMYLKGNLEKQFDSLREEHNNNETFNAPDVYSFRNLPVSLSIISETDTPKGIYECNRATPDGIIDQILGMINKGFK